jgi:hypothetical protein
MRSTRTGPELPRGEGPLSGAEPVGGRPIDDPAMSDRANPRWDDPTSPKPDAQPLANPDGTPNVMPADRVDVPVATPQERERGTEQDQAAQPLDADVGSDNIREGRGGGAANPAMAEGGDSG